MENSPYSNPSDGSSFSEAAPSSGKLPHSGLGIASFVLAILAGILGLAGMGLAVYARQKLGADSIHSPENVAGGGMILLAFLGWGIGFILGVISLFMKGKNKIFGILGVVLSVLPGVGFLALVAIGLAMGRHGQ